MTAPRTFLFTEPELDAALERKGTTRISVCIPCRNEAATIPDIAEQIVRTLMTPGMPIVDELIVIDDDSTDATASVAASAGATVVAAHQILPEEPIARGKGNALWKSVAASSGDIILWCDGDLLSFTPSYIRRLAAPFLVDPDLGFVKGFYDRVPDANGEGGGRTTELVARPLLASLFPALTSIRQPLGGEYGGRRSLLEQLSFATGYGVEIGLLIDAWRLVGSAGIAQVDLGIRRHRHRSLHELGAQSVEILHATLTRAGLSSPTLTGLSTWHSEGHQPIPVQIVERPPLIELTSYRERQPGESRQRNEP